MSSKKLLTIFGATGNQGGSVISAILNHPNISSKYRLRAITRDTSKPAARSLASKGVELAKADLNDPASISEAIKGSYGVFAVTNYWETMNAEIEYTQGTNIVNACASAHVTHLVWSALPHASKLTQGKLNKIEHFDSKAKVQEYAEQHKGDMLVSYVMPGYFMSNLLTQLKPTGNDNEYSIDLPWNPEKTQVGLINIRVDTGLFVAGLFEAASAANGVAVQAVSEWTTPAQVASTISSATGKKVVFRESEMTVEMADTMEKIPAELMENMMLIRDYSYFGVGAEGRQGESDKFFLQGVGKQNFADFAKSATWKL